MIWLVMVGCTGNTPTPTGVDTDDTDPPEDTAPPTPVDPYDCANPRPVPVDYTVLQNFGNAEDFDFDRQGRHVSVGFDGNMVARERDGTQTLIAPNISQFTACTRRLPDGDFVVCDVGANSLIRINPETGERTVLASGMEYPNGAEVDPEGFVYVAEQSAGRVRQVNSETGFSTLIATNLEDPNGVIFSPDWQTLYVGSFGGGVVYAIDRAGPDDWEAPRILAEQQGISGGFDGINVDICGNVYVTEFGPGRIARISPDGDAVLAVDLPSGWIPNMRWGNGVGGWDENTLYVSDRDLGRLFALDIGIPGKPDFPDPAP